MSIKNGNARWAFDLFSWRPTLNELITATTCIQSEEKQRLSKFVFRDDFDASLIGRLLMRKFVRDTSNLSYDKIIFNRDNRGKPYLQNNISDSVDFNVSHQGSFAVLAGYISPPHNDKSKIPSIGVDVMKMEYSGGKPLQEFFRLMHRNFSVEEWMYINGKTTPLRQTEAFMRHWCLKESYVKNIGIGITIDLQKISFSIQTDDELSSTKPITNTKIKVDDLFLDDWKFEESLIDNMHCVAVSLQNSNTSTNDESPLFEILDFNKLMEGCQPLLNVDHEYCTAILSKPYKNA